MNVYTLRVVPDFEGGSSQYEHDSKQLTFHEETRGKSERYLINFFFGHLTGQLSIDSSPTKPVKINRSSTRK